MTVQAAAMDGGAAATGSNSAVQGSSTPPVDLKDLKNPPPATEDDPYSLFRKHKHKYKASGREVEVDYDELLRRASLADGSEKKLQSAALQRKELEERLGKLSNAEADNWEDIIELIGWEKAKKFAETLLWNNIQWEELPEAERRAILAEQKLTKLERERETEQKKKEEEAKTQAMEQAYQIIDKEISEAIAEAKAQGVSLADMPEVVEQVVDEMIAYLEYVEAEEKEGRAPKSSTLSPKDVLKKIQDRYDNRSSAYVKKLTGEQLKAILTKEQLAALRKLELDHLHAPIPAHEPGTARAKKSDVSPFEVEPNQKDQRRMSSDEYFKRMDAKFNRR